MPSLRPTTLKPGDRTWWREGSDVLTGAVERVLDDGRGLVVVPDQDQGYNPGAVLAGGATTFHPLYDLSPDVMAAGDVCAYLGRKRDRPISYERLRQLRARIDFPTPAQTTAGEIWDAPAIRAWDHDRANQRDNNATRALASYRALQRAGNPNPSIYAVAKSTGMAYSTVRRHLLTCGVVTTKEPEDADHTE